MIDYQLSKKHHFMVVFLVVLCVMVVAMAQSSAPAFAAEEKEYLFDKTDVIEDLEATTINGKNIEFKDYPAKDGGDPEFMFLTEFGYSYSVEDMDNYALYIYVYNPSCSTLSGTGNKVTMATAFDSNGDGFAWSKFDLVMCSVSIGEYADRFYKFRVIDSDLANRVKSIGRKYDISEIELYTQGASSAVAYKIARSYTFTGYAAGLGEDVTADSTLSCKSSVFDTIELSLKQTTYRTGVSSKGAGHYNQVNTVWFTVPAKYWRSFDYLYAITSEWYEYKTKPMLVTNSTALYDAMYSAREKYIDSYDSSIPALYGGGARYDGFDIYSYTIYDWAYNISVTNFNEKADCLVRSIPFVFKAESKPDLSFFQKLFTTRLNTGNIGSSEVEQYIQQFPKTAGTLSGKNGSIASFLFEDTVDDGCTRGYNKKTISLDDLFNLESYLSNHSWWDAFIQYGFKQPDLGDDYSNVSPIQELSLTDAALSDDTFSKTLLIGTEEVSELKKDISTAALTGDKVVLFRFAVRDYFSQQVGVLKRCSISLGENEDAYVAQETVFFDFDILSLTFKKDGEKYEIPAVASPIDIIGGIDPPAEETVFNTVKNAAKKLGIDTDKADDWMRWILIILGILLGVVVLSFLLTYLFKFIDLISKSKEASRARRERRAANKKSKNRQKSRAPNPRK